MNVENSGHLSVIDGASSQQEAEAHR